MEQQKTNLMRNLGVVALSVVVAVVLAKTGALKDLLTTAQEWRILGSLVAGMFFVSVFTAAPAAVVLAELALSSPVLEVALFGGLGGLLGDWLIFRFIKDSLAEDLAYLLKKTKRERWAGIFHRQLFRRLMPFIGALLVASPLPDELGLAMLGLSKIKTWLFIPLAFTLNFLGILIMGLIAREMFN